MHKQQEKQRKMLSHVESEKANLPAFDGTKRDSSDQA